MTVSEQTYTHISKGRGAAGPSGIGAAGSSRTTAAGPFDAGEVERVGVAVLR